MTDTPTNIFCRLALCLFLQAAAGCVKKGNRTELVSVTAYAKSSTGQWTSDTATDAASLQALVDGAYSATDTGWFRTMEDNVYLEFATYLPTKISSVKLYLQHDLASCTFQWYGPENDILQE